MHGVSHLSTLFLYLSTSNTVMMWLSFVIFCGITAGQQIQTVCSSYVKDGINVTSNGTSIGPIRPPGLPSSMERIQQLETDVRMLKQSLATIMETKRKEPISFLAVKDNIKTIQAVADRGIVNFPIVKHNKAPAHFGYDSKISVFRCPENGTYMFSTGLTAYDGSIHYHFAIMKEGKVLATTYTYSNSGHAACSATVTTDCKKGDDVWVANVQGSSRNLHADQEGVNHFTGFKIN